MKRIDTKTRMNKTVCLKDEINNFMEYLGLDSKLSEMKIIEVWKLCVGDTIAKFSTPVEIKRNKLLVSVENSVWRYELSLKKKEIIELINENLKQVKNAKLIKDIIFV